MKVRDIISKCSFTLLNEADTQRDITGVYVGDLLSWVMGRAEEGQVWITIMTNINIVAVASLSEVSAILLTEGSEIEVNVIEKAKEQGINILRTEMSSYEAALAVGEINR